MDTKKIVKNRKVYSEAKDIGFGRRPNSDNARVLLRYDDFCGNGRNSFGITVDAKNYGGCMHEEIREHFPEYSHLIKWHLCFDNEPLHYVANTVYWAKQGNLEYARNSAIAPNATIEQLQSEEWLMARLPALMDEFHAAMASIDWIEG